MKLLFAPLLVFILPLVTGCQIPYLLKNSWHQTKILKSRVDIKDVLENPKITDETKRKLRLVESAKSFSENQLGLAYHKHLGLIV